MTQQAQDAPSFVGYDSSAIPDSTTHVNTDDELLDGMTIGMDGTELPTGDDDADDNPYEEFLAADNPDLEESAALMAGKNRSTKAKSYEKKVAALFATGVKVTIQTQRTRADSAALLVHGPTISLHAGDLAATNAKVAAFIDTFSEGTTNPTIALAVACAPLVLQIVRNHEPTLETEQRGIRVFKRKGEWVRLRFRVPFRVFRKMRGFTRDPNELTYNTLTDPLIVEALRKQGINVTEQ